MNQVCFSQHLRAVIYLFLLCLWSVSSAAETDWPQLQFTQFASGISAPTSIAAPGDGSERLFVTEQSGRVMLVRSNSVSVFLNLQDRVQYIPGTELGLLTVAFPPGFATNRHFYVFYNGLGDDSTPARSRISRFQLSSTNSDIADPSTEQVVLSLPYPEESVYTLSGGQLVFGPDGYLYIGMGDSGFGGALTNHAQKTRSLQGKILRIDVENSSTYKIPVDNPFVGNTNYLPEIWALGLRNPWRFSFDRANGDFYMADVGQIESEEINFLPAPASGGQNYGWPIREGRHYYTGPDHHGLTLTDPVFEYLHTGPPASVTGGHVYCGSVSNRMSGIYFFADAYSGKISGLKRNGAQWVSQLLAQVPYFITSFGEDQAGRLYLADYISGKIFSISDAGNAAAPTFTPLAPIATRTRSL